MYVLLPRLLGGGGGGGGGGAKQKKNDRAVNIGLDLSFRRIFQGKAC